MLSRGAARAATCSSTRILPRQPRRFNSHSAGHGDHGHSESAFHVAGGSGNESMGRGFYVTVALVPLGMVAYTVATSSDKPILTDLINAWKDRSEEVDKKNVLHQTFIEQASVDSQLFRSAKASTSDYEMRFPERLNAGSPWNVAAGQGSADMGQLMEHLAKKQKQKEEERVGRMVDGKVVTVYDDTTGGRFPSWMPWVGTTREVKPGYKE